MACAVKHQAALLLGRLGWHEPHVGSGDGFTNRLSVSHVVLLPFDVRLHVSRRHQPHGMAECLQLARPIVRRGAGLDANQAWRQLLEERQDGATLQLAADNHLVGSINAVDLEDRLGDVETDCRDCLHGVAPLNRGSLNSAHIHGTHVPGGGRPRIKAYNVRLGALRQRNELVPRRRDLFARSSRGLMTSTRSRNLTAPTSQTPASRAPYLAGDGKGAKAAPFAAVHLVAIGTKRTSKGCRRMSAVGGKPDTPCRLMTQCVLCPFRLLPRLVRWD